VRGLIIPPGIAARKGSSVHKGAEVIHRAKVDGKDITADDAADATRDEYRRLVTEEGVMLTPEEREDKNAVLNEGLNGAVAAVKSYRTHVSPGINQIALIEERLYADTGAGIPVSGKPDVVADGLLIDIKTAGKRWIAGQEDLQIQPTIYRMLLKENGFGPLPARYVILSPAKQQPKDNGCLYDPEHGVCVDTRDTERTDEHERKMKLRIKAVADMIQRGDFPPGPPDQWWCTPKFCGYYGTVCKYT
jgi:hypothetical protein